MHRFSLALALASALAVTGCGGSYGPDGSGDGKGTAGVDFTVTVNNQGPGTVSDGSNTCAAPVAPAKNTICVWTYASGTAVVLTGTPSGANYFNGFFGGCSGWSCTLTGGADQYVVAYFSATPEVHPNFNDGSVHGPAWTAYALDCKACHGPNAGQGEDYSLNKGQGLAIGCGKCHGTPNANPAFVERCSTCHLDGAAHPLADQLGVKVTPGAVTVSGSDVVVQFAVTVNGVPRNDFVNKASVVRNHNEDASWVYDAVQKAGVRAKLSPLGNFTVVSNGNGRYTATLTGLATTPPVPGTKYMFSVMNGSPIVGDAATYGATATVVATWGTPAHDVVGDQACVNCHGQLVWRDAVHDVTYPQGIGPCVVCHNRTGSADPRLPGSGTGLMGIVHGVHNSKNMPDQQYTFTWASNGRQFDFSVGFPGNMHNCATCHDGAARLDAVKNADVSYALCISCHDGWEAFPAAPASHLAFTATTGETCTASACHDGTAAPRTIAGFHDGLITERAGLIWGGADQSVVLAPTIKLDITGARVSGANLVVTWTAKNANGVAYDPCNQDFAKGPVFFGYPGSGSSEGCTNTAVGCASNMSILRAYAQADDWVNDAYPGGTSPGQPRSTNLASANTTCVNGVATTTVPVQAVGATRGIIALQGKPQVKWAANGNVIWVRAQTPTREFVVADGSLPAVQRRELVDVNKCNACHLGTLYQHGGSRVDKIEMCVMCHDPSSSEQNNRLGMGVTAANAYDGKPGQTYDLRTLVHAVHSAGETKVPLMYYRSNGIYFFGAKDATTGALLGVSNWPNEADCVKCVDAEDGPLTWCKVYGSSATGKDYTTARNADGTCKDADTELPASTDGTWRPHRVIEVHYPRPIEDCAACHFTSNPGFADPTKAAAVTVDAGVSPWNNLVDDSLVGPNVAACFTCHQSSDPLAQAALRKHGYDHGWTPQVFANGRQELLNWATCGFATCP